MTVDVPTRVWVVDLLASGRFEATLAPLHLALANGDESLATRLNIAIVEDHAGDRGRARRLMQQLAVCRPDLDEPLLRLAESFRAAGEINAAEEAYRQVLQVNPGRPEALIALAVLLLMGGQPKSARDFLVECCRLVPTNAEAWCTLGFALHGLGEARSALVAFITAQQLRPHYMADVLNGVEVTLDAGACEAESIRLGRLAEQDPLNSVPLIGLGMLLERLGRRSEAVDALEGATELAPDQLLPLRLFAGVLARSGKVGQAEHVLRRLRAMDLDDPQAWNDYATVLMRLHRHAEARTILQGVPHRHGPHASILCNLANATVCVGEQDQAVVLARRAIELDPAAALPRRALCNALPYREGTTGKMLLTAMRDYSNTLSRNIQPLLQNVADSDRPLVIGLLSGTLRSHPVGWLTVAGIESLDPEQFQVVCLVQNSIPEDPMAGRFLAIAHDWIETDNLDDEALTALSRERGIDILIDLGGNGDAARMSACANRLAPVQIKWVGMQAHSSGLTEMDWFLTDRWETPEGFEPFYSEKLLCLPNGYICYTSPPHAPDVVALPALANGFITFGCFNNLAKITPLVIETWAEILRQVPNARLVLKTHQLSHSPTAQGFQADFATLGISDNRVEMRGSSGHRVVMSEYGDIDIVLDPFPYSGGLTTCEALWMGVPTITLPGEIFASRHSGSHMSNVGLSSWVTGSVEAYIGMAVARAGDLLRLAELRATLREKMRCSPLCDVSCFGNNLGAVLRHAWTMWCEK